MFSQLQSFFSEVSQIMYDQQRNRPFKSYGPFGFGYALYKWYVVKTNQNPIRDDTSVDGIRQTATTLFRNGQYEEAFERFKRVISKNDGEKQVRDYMYCVTALSLALLQKQQSVYMNTENEALVMQTMELYAVHTHGKGTLSDLVHESLRELQSVDDYEHATLP